MQLLSLTMPALVRQARCSISTVSQRRITLSTVVAQDVGFAMNPAYIEGQIEGGVAQGLGQALSEEIVYDNERVLNARSYASIAFLRSPLPSASIPTSIRAGGLFGLSLTASSARASPWSNRPPPAQADRDRLELSPHSVSLLRRVL